MTIRSIASVLAFGLLAAIPSYTLAQPTEKVAAPHVQIANPIKILSCNPSKGNTVYGAGYSPAYYPPGVGPYWGWPSVYGPGYMYYAAAPVQTNPSLGIDYKNNTNVVMKDIEFGLVAKGTLVAEVRDSGTFSPDIEIKHSFGLNPNVFPLGTGLPQCVPLKITFADGTKWKNPHLPALKASIYGRPH